MRPRQLEIVILHVVNLAKQDPKGKRKIVETRGIEPRAFRMRSGRSTTELHPQLAQRVLQYNY